MRIAILTVILVLLLGPSLRPGVAASSPAPLHPTAAFPNISGTVQSEQQGGRATFTIALRGVPIKPSQLPPTNGAAAPAYVAWLVDGERRLYNLGSLTVNSAGEALSTFTPIAAPTGSMTVAVSLEPRADLVAPSAPRETILASGQIAPLTPADVHSLDSDFGPGWFAPIIPATLGLFLLRHAARTRRAELRARRTSVTAPAPGA